MAFTIRGSTVLSAGVHILIGVPAGDGTIRGIMAIRVGTTPGTIRGTTAATVFATTTLGVIRTIDGMATTAGAAIILR